MILFIDKLTRYLTASMNYIATAAAGWSHFCFAQVSCISGIIPSGVHGVMCSGGRDCILDGVTISAYSWR